MSCTGFVNIIKPTGMTSFAVVSKVKKILGTKKVGHLGTLDPAAAGVLPIAVGKATKYFDYFLNKEKEYVARVKFGIETDTLDSFGKVIKKIDRVVSLNDIENILPKFLGEIKQTPPKFSAVKIDGKRAYDLARSNADFEIAPKTIKIESIIVSACDEENEFLFRVKCSAGTYIRTLMSDIASEINSISTTFSIIRVKSGLFDINNAITLEEFEQSKKILKVTDVFNNLKIIIVNENIFKKLSNGVSVYTSEIDSDLICDEIFFIQYNNDIVGMYKIDNGKLVKIINLLD